MPQVLNEVDVSSASVVGVVTPAVMPSWPEFGLRAVFRLSQGAATIRLKGDGHIIHEFALPIVSGNKLGERQKDMLIPGLYSTWSWELVSISGGGVVYCRATAAAEDTPVTMEHLSFASLLSSLQAKMARDLVEGTGTETIDVQVSWHTNMKDVSAINLNTTALTINNMTTGTSDASFNNNGIPPGRWVWCVLSGASSGNKPTALMLTMTGYRRNRSY